MIQEVYTMQRASYRHCPRTSAWAGVDKPPLPPVIV